MILNRYIKKGKKNFDLLFYYLLYLFVNGSFVTRNLTTGVSFAFPSKRDKTFY